MTQRITVHLGSAGSTKRNNRNNLGRTIRTKYKQKRNQKKLVQQRLLLPAIVEEDDIWGDIPIGDHKQCRVVMQNVNGIKSEHEYASAHEIAEQVQQIEGNIFGLIETNVDWKGNG
jgi:hypothetical protein